MLTASHLRRLVGAALIALTGSLAIAGTANARPTYLTFAELKPLQTAVGYPADSGACPVGIRNAAQNLIYLYESAVDPSCARPANQYGWLFSNASGSWQVIATAASTVKTDFGFCPTFDFTTPIITTDQFFELHRCGVYPPTGQTYDDYFLYGARTPGAATPIAPPVATPTPKPVTTPGPGGSGGSSDSYSPTRSAGNTTLLCLPNRGRSGRDRVNRRKPTACNTLGPNGSFARSADLRGLRWRSWGRSVAYASGWSYPFKAGAPRVRVTVTASRPRLNDCGTYTYTRLTLRTKFGTARLSFPTSCGG